MLPKKHTEIGIIITPVGDEPIKQTFLFKDVVLNTIDDVENYVSWGGDANWILSNAQYISTYGILDNWEITRHELFTDSDLGIRWAIENSNRLEEKRKKSLEEEFKSIGCHGFINPSGEFIKVPMWHLHWAEDYIDSNGLYERYMNDKKHRNMFSGFSPCDFLESIGWVRVKGDRNNDNYVENAFFKTINNAQLKTLNLICLKYDKPFKKVVYHSEWLWNLEKNKKHE